MDIKLKTGFDEFKWNSNNIMKGFIDPSMSLVKSTYDIMVNMQGNLENIENILIKQRIPLIEKSKKTTTPSDFMTV